VLGGMDFPYHSFFYAINSDLAVQVATTGYFRASWVD